MVVGHEVRGLHGPGLVRALAATGCAECAGVGATLSPRELRMLQMLAGGASYRSIGAHMGVPAATVRGYLAKLYAKLGTGDAASTVAEAVRRGWVAA